MEDLFKEWTNYLSVGIEACAALIIGIAVIEASLQAANLLFLQRNSPEHHKDLIRIKLGRWLAVALELELAADILGTAIAPTWDEIGKLAAIIVLRTVLNFFLQREIDNSKDID